MQPQRDSRKLVGLAVPADDALVREHAQALLKRHGLYAKKVVAVYSAASPGALRGKDTILYVNTKDEPRWANVWRGGPNKRQIKVRSDAGWPVDNPPPMIL